MRTGPVATIFQTQGMGYSTPNQNHVIALMWVVASTSSAITPLYDRVKPLPTRVPSDGPLPGLNKNIVLSKSVPGYFMKDDEPVYVRVMEMVHLDKDAPQKTRSFILGLEMKSPLNGVEGLAEIKDVKPTNLPFVYTIQRPSQTILVIRALGVTSGKEKQPKVATSSPSKADN